MRYSGPITHFTNTIFIIWCKAVDHSGASWHQAHWGAQLAFLRSFLSGPLLFKQPPGVCRAQTHFLHFLRLILQPILRVISFAWGMPYPPLPCWADILSFFESFHEHQTPSLNQPSSFVIHPWPNLFSSEQLKMFLVTCCWCFYTASFEMAGTLICSL